MSEGAQCPECKRLHEEQELEQQLKQRERGMAPTAVVDKIKDILTRQRGIEEIRIRTVKSDSMQHLVSIEHITVSFRKDENGNQVECVMLVPKDELVVEPRLDRIERKARFDREMNARHDPVPPGCR